MDLETNISPELKSNIKNFLTFLKYEKGLSDNTISSYEHDLQRYVKFVSIDNNCKTINDVKLSLLKDFFYLLYDCFLTPQTQNRYLSAIRGFHKYLWEEDIIKADITPKIKLHKTNRPIPDVLSVEQIDMLLQSVDTVKPTGIRDKAIIEVFYACGMRVSELINFKLQDYILDEELVRIIGKGNKERIVPIGKEAIFWLNEYLNKGRSFLLKEQKKTDIVFLNQHGRKLTRMGIWWLLDSYVQNNNLPFKLHPHIFRHSYATHLLEGGVDLRIVQELLGHASVNTTQIYTHVDNTYLKEVYSLCHPRARIN